MYYSVTIHTYTHIKYCNVKLYKLYNVIVILSKLPTYTYIRIPVKIFNRRYRLYLNGCRAKLPPLYSSNFRNLNILSQVLVFRSIIITLIRTATFFNFFFRDFFFTDFYTLYIYI